MIPDVRCDSTTLDATLSSYTEQSPRPTGIGSPSDSRSRSRIAASGAQDDGLVVRVLQAGEPVLGESANHCGWRLDGDAAALNRGWEPPHTIDQWHSPAWSAAEDYGAPDLCRIPRTQKVVGAWALDLALGLVQRLECATWNPTTRLWGAAVTVDADIGGQYAVAGITCLPWNERIVLVAASTVTARGRLYYSDDAGATWVVGSTSCLMDALTAPVSAKPTCRLLALPTGDLALLVSEVGAPGRVQQYVSGSLGTGFRRVLDNNTGYDHADACVTPQGGLVIAAILNSDSTAYVFSPASPWTAFDEARSVQVSATTLDEVSIVCDDDGRLWLHGRSQVVADYWYTWTSADGGASWTQTDHGLTASGNTSYYLTRLAMAPSLGGMVWASSFNLAGMAPAHEGSLAGGYAGGWSSLTLGPSGGTKTDPDCGRTGWGPTALATRTVQQYLPIIVPASISAPAPGPGTPWIQVLGGAAVGVSLSAVYGCAMAAALAADTEWYYVVPPVGELTAGIEAHITYSSVGGRRSILSVAVNNGGTGWHITLDLGTSSAQVGNALTGASLTGVFGFTKPLVFRMFLSNGHIYAAWRTQGGTTWTEVLDTTIAGAATAQHHVGWGILPGVVNATICFGQVGVIGRPHSTSSTLWNTDADSTTVYQRPLGKALTGLPYPAILTAGGETTWLRAVSGPAYADEAHTLDPEHDYPVEHAHWDVAASPKRQWLSVDDATNQRLAWVPDGLQETDLGSIHPALYVDAATFKEGALQGWTGAAWVALGTLSLVVGTGLTGTLTGSHLVPRTGTAALSRYLYPQDIAGGTAKLEGGGNTAWVRIRSQTEGVWREPVVGTSGPRVARVYLDLDTYTGALPPDGAVTVELWSPRGMLVCPEQTVLYQAYCLNVLAQDTAGNAIGAGLVLPGAWQPLRPWDWGLDREREGTYIEAEGDDGSVQRSKRGAPVTTWRPAWADGLDARQTQGSGSTPDPGWYSTQATDAGSINAGESPWALWGLLDRAASGAAPVVLCAGLAAPTGSVCVTDPSRLHCGYLGGTMTLQRILGVQGQSELFRVLTLALRGL